MATKCISTGGYPVSVSTPGDSDKAAAVDPIPASTVTDIATAQAAISSLEATVNTLIQSLQDAGLMEQP